MKFLTALIFGLILLPTTLGAPFAYAEDETYVVNPVVSLAHVRFNNENWETLPHPEVAEFTVRDDGSAFGLTVLGVPFKQYYVPNDLGIRVQRFEIEDHYHYIVEGTIAYSTEDLSIELARAYEAKVATS